MARTKLQTPRGTPSFPKHFLAGLVLAGLVAACSSGAGSEASQVTVDDETVATATDLTSSNPSGGEVDPARDPLLVTTSASEADSGTPSSDPAATTSSSSAASSSTTSVTTASSAATDEVTAPTTAGVTEPTSPPATTSPSPSATGFKRCSFPATAEISNVDFQASRASGADVQQLNQGRLGGQPTFVRTVFELPSDRMRWEGQGLGLSFDVGTAGPLDYRYRSEIREARINVAIPADTTQAYCVRFKVLDLPDLFGPVTIFQRFNRDVDGPDLDVELTGANQFSDAVSNDLQVVAFGARHRIGSQLANVNTLMVVIHNHRSNGSYKVVLNGRTIQQGQGINTVGSSAGGWAQFGLYPHGLYSGDNRQDQINSGQTAVRFEYVDFSIASLDQGSPDLSGFSVD